MNKHESARRRGSGESRDFWLQLLIPAVLLVLLLIVIAGVVPREALVPSIVVVAVGLLTSGAVGFFSGIRGPMWLIYGLILAELGLLLLFPAPWRGLALVCIPVSAIGFAIGKDVAYFRYNRRHGVSESNGLSDHQEA